MLGAARQPSIHLTLDDYNAGHTLARHETPPYLWQFEFERLYTELNQRDLKSKLAEFSTLAFALHLGQVLVLSSREPANWKAPDHQPKQHEMVYAAERAMELVNFIIDHAYIQVGSQVFQQVKGIPMGVNPACFFADNYLFVSKYHFFRLLLPNAAAGNLTALRAVQAFRYSGRNFFKVR